MGSSDDKVQIQTLMRRTNTKQHQLAYLSIQVRVFSGPVQVHD